MKDNWKEKIFRQAKRHHKLASLCRRFQKGKKGEERMLLKDTASFHQNLSDCLLSALQAFGPRNARRRVVSKRRTASSRTAA